MLYRLSFSRGWKPGRWTVEDMHQEVVGSFLRYCVAAALSFGANLSLTWALHSLFGTLPELAFAIALIVVILMNFFLARHYIYRVGNGCAFDQLPRYLVATLSFRAAEYAGFILLHTLLGIMYLLAAGTILATSFIVKFFVYGSKVFVLR